MRVLVTGSEGFLGTHYLRHLDQDDRVEHLVGVDIKPALWTLTEQADIVDWVRSDDTQWDLVVHMAGVVGGRVKIEGDPLYNADQLRIDSAVFRWAATHAKKLLYPSSSAVYGVEYQGDEPVVLREGLLDVRTTDPWPRPDAMYGFTKLAGEVLAFEAEKYGLVTLIMRPFSGYGEGQSLDYPVPSIALRAKRREDPLMVWGPGTQVRDFIHVNDLVEKSLEAVEDAFTTEAINFGSGVGTSFNEVAAMCARIAGYSPDIANITTKPTGVANRVGDVTRMRGRHGPPKVSLEDGLRRVMESLDVDG